MDQVIAEDLGVGDMPWHDMGAPRTEGDSLNMAYVSLMGVKSPASGHHYSIRDLERDDTKDLADLLKKMRFREPFDAEKLPRYLVREKETQRAPKAVAAGFFVVNSALADILRRHDLGEGFLWEMPLMERDGSRNSDNEMWFGLHVGSFKDTIDLAASSAVKQGFGSPSISGHRVESGTGKLVLGAAAEHGLDVWREERLGGPLYFFISDRLAEALTQAGTAKDLFLYPCYIA